MSSDLKGTTFFGYPGNASTIVDLLASADIGIMPERLKKTEEAAFSLILCAQVS